MSLPKKYVVALFVAFLYYAGQIAARTVEENRYYDLWGRADAAAVVLGMLLLAGAAVGLERAVARLGPPWAKRLFDHVFLVALVGGMLAAAPTFSRDHPNVVQILWMGSMAAIGFSLAWARSRLVRWAANFCLVFSPAVLLVSIQMFTWSAWAPSGQPGTADARPASSGPPVVVCIFDEWSYTRSTERGQFLPFYKNVRELCRQSVVFHRALSPGTETMQSLPRFLFQTDRQYLVRDGQTLFDGDRPTPTGQMASLFQLARDHGYTTTMMGWYHPYGHMLDGQVDRCQVFSRDGLRGDLAWRVGWRLYTNLQYLTDPVSRRLGPRLEEDLVSAHWFAMANGFRDEMLGTLRELRPGGLAVFHEPLPHAPFVFNPDGTYAGPNLDMTQTEPYLRQLEYLDVLVGQIVEALRASGKFDDALVVLTSDHGWRFDPDPSFRQESEWKRRVPLIVKLPGQRSGDAVEGEFCTARLRPLFEAVVGGDRNPEELLRITRQMAAGDEGTGSARGTTDRR